MGYIVTSSPEKKQSDRFYERLIQYDQVKDIKEELDKLKSAMAGQTDKEPRSSQAGDLLDYSVEHLFDTKAAQNKEQIQTYIRQNNFSAIQALLDKWCQEDSTISKTLETIKEYTKEQIRFDLNQLVFSVLQNQNIDPRGIYRVGNVVYRPGSTQSVSDSNQIFDNPTAVIRSGNTKLVDGLVVGTTRTNRENLGHNEVELTEHGLGDVWYKSYTYAEGFLSRKQQKIYAKQPEEFDPTLKRKYTYKSKHSEYRETNKKVQEVMLDILDGLKKTKKNGEHVELVKHDIKNIDWKQVGYILYLITAQDIKATNPEFIAGANASRWSEFLNTSKTGIYIPAEKEQAFVGLVKQETDYPHAKIPQLLNFLRCLDGDSLEYINKIIDLTTSIYGANVVKKEIIETGNIRSILDSKQVFACSPDLSPEEFMGEKRTQNVEATRGEKSLLATQEQKSILPLEETGNFFWFLADMNNDGRVDQYDRGSGISGYAYYAMLQSICDVKKKDDTFVIVNGPRTSVVLKNMLSKIKEFSVNQIINKEIDRLLQMPFLHTYHVFSFVQSYPLAKAQLLYNIQQEMEHERRKANPEHTYHAFNPELAMDSEGLSGVDFIREYFTSENIRHAFGDIIAINIQELSDIAKQQGITISHGVDVQVVKAVNIIVSTLFLNFGPLMRMMEHIVLHTGKRFENKTSVYDPANSDIAIQGNISLSKDHLYKPRSRHEIQNMLSNQAFREAMKKLVSIRPVVGVRNLDSTPVQPHPIVGLGVFIDSEQLDPNRKRRETFANLGISSDILDGVLFCGLETGFVAQTNRKKLQRNFSDIRKPYAKGIGISLSLGSNWNVLHPGSMGVFGGIELSKNINHLVGIEQVKRNFEKFLSVFEEESIPFEFFTQNPKSPTQWDAVYIKLKEFYMNQWNKNPEYASNKYTVLKRRFVNFFVNKLQTSKVLEGLHDRKGETNQTLSNTDKQHIIKACMRHYIDGYVAHLYHIYTQQLVEKGFTLSKIGFRLGANLTVQSLLTGGPFAGILGLSLRGNAYNKLYFDDVEDIASVSKELDWGAGMYTIEIKPGSTLENIAHTIEKKFCLPELVVSVENNTLVFQHKDSHKSVLDILHLYYTQESLDKKEFFFDGKKIVVGNVSTLGLAHVFKAESQAHYLIVGSDKMISCREHTKHIKNPDGTIIRDPLGSGAVGSETDIVPIPTTTVTVLPDKQKILEYLQNVPDFVRKNLDTWISAVNIYGEMELSVPDEVIKEIPYRNGKHYIPAHGTLVYIQDLQGKVTLRYVATPADRFILEYKKQIKKLEHADIIQKTQTITISADIPSEYSTIEEILSSVQDRVRTFSTTYADNVLAFFARVKNISDDTINDQDYMDALSGIQEKLIKHVQHPRFTQLLADCSIDKLKCIYVINRLKALFAYQESLHSGAHLSSLLKQRGDRYAHIPGPCKENIPKQAIELLNSIRSQRISDHAGKKENLQKHTQKNILAYTAWYRRGGKIKDAWGYSSTAYEHTNYIASCYQVLSPSVPGYQNLRMWLINNISSDDAMIQTVLTRLNEGLKKHNMQLTSHHIRPLLEYGECAIDNTGKKIKINTEMVFYLLGECANESLGLQLDYDTIQIVTPMVNPESIYETGIATITPEQKMMYNIRIKNTTKTVDLDQGVKKANIGTILQSSMPFDRFKETSTDATTEEYGGQGGGENPGESGGQGTGEKNIYRGNYGITTKPLDEGGGQGGSG